MATFTEMDEMIKKGFTPVMPGNPGIRDLLDHKQRGIAMYKLPRQKNLCKWCWVGKTKTGRHFYCSPECELSIDLFCYPQGNRSWAFLDHRQHGKCNICEYEFATGLKKRPYGYTITTGWDEVNNRPIKKKEVDYIRDNGEIDHIIPIHQGGTALGHENLQLLCTECHHIKSANERRKK